MIAIVDYGLGNVSAFANIYKSLNIPHQIANRPEVMAEATKIILPGVGAFDHAIQQLNDSGMREGLDKAVLQEGTPVLGICVGMQMMARSSEEGTLPGLGWIDGVVKKLDPANLTHRPHLPHMGWNNVLATQQNDLLKNLDNKPVFYFLHSFFFSCADSSDVIAETDYGGTFACAVNAKNVYGIQCHPEKSHRNGIQLLENFARI